MTGPTPGSPGDSHGPYIGPRPFRQSEANRFFGRRLEARDVMSLWLGDQVTVLHGASAVGKTSLLQAGVLPLASRRAGVDLLPVGSLNHQPARPLAIQPPRNSFSHALLGTWAQLGQLHAPDISIAEFLASRARQVSRTGDPHYLLAVIDQFEMLFKTFPARQAERDGFIDELGTALRQVPALKLLLVISDDRLGALGAYSGQLSDHALSYVRLDRLSRDGALDAVAGPLTGTERRFDAGVGEELIDRLRTVVYTDLAGESATIIEDRVEPLLLQIVCAELWSSLPGGVQIINSRDLRAFGGTDQALTHFYDSAIQAARLETGHSEEQLRAWVETTFITEHGTRGTACRGILMTAGMPNEVADALEQRHVLTAEYRARSIWLQLGQDAMIAPIRAANRAWRATHGRSVPQLPAPATPVALSAAAEAALAEGNFPSAHRFARAAAANYRQAGDSRRMAYALVLEGDIARSEGDLNAAQQNLQAALSEFAILEDRNSTVRTLSALANVYFLDGDYQTAADFDRQAVERLPTDVQALIGLGYALWYGGSTADADATFTQALSWDGSSASALAGRGQVRAEMREHAAALADLDSAFAGELPPAEQIDARSARALALAGLSRDEEADRDLAMARALDPGAGRTQRRAARIAALRGDRVLAADQARRALQASPPLPPWDEADARHLLETLTPEDV